MNETTNKTLVQEIIWLKDRIKALEEECLALKKKWLGAREIAIEALDETYRQERLKDY